MTRLLAALLAASLAGCATERDAPLTGSFPVPVSCEVAVPSAPMFAVYSLPIGAEVDRQMAALRAERLQRIGYEKELIAALTACRRDIELP